MSARAGPVSPQPPRIAPDAPGTSLTPLQHEFNSLVQEVAAWRRTLAAWNERIERCDRTLEPIRHQVHAELRLWVFALDACSLRGGLSRRESTQVGELIREAAGELLAFHGGDSEIAAVLRQHEVQAAPRTPHEPAEPTQEEEPAGGDAAIEDVEAHWQRAADIAAADRERRAAVRRAAKKQRLQAGKEKEVSQSLRDVYRKLASILHPDRESDAALRERKTVLMQQANRAYAEENLLALLEMQWEAEQIDAARLASLDQRRIDHYVTVLRGQLAELQRETRERESAFRAALGAPAGAGMPAKKADRMITAEAQRLRGDVDLLRQQTRLLADEETTKEWLRALRQRV